MTNAVNQPQSPRFSQVRGFDIHKGLGRVSRQLNGVSNAQQPSVPSRVCITPGPHERKACDIAFSAAYEVLRDSPCKARDVEAKNKALSILQGGPDRFGSIIINQLVVLGALRLGIEEQMRSGDTTRLDVRLAKVDQAIVEVGLRAGRVKGVADGCWRPDSASKALHKALDEAEKCVRICMGKGEEAAALMSCIAGAILPGPMMDALKERLPELAARIDAGDLELDLAQVLHSGFLDGTDQAIRHNLSMGDGEHIASAIFDLLKLPQYMVRSEPGAPESPGNRDDNRPLSPDEVRKLANSNGPMHYAPVNVQGAPVNVKNDLGFLRDLIPGQNGPTVPLELVYNLLDQAEARRKEDVQNAKNLVRLEASNALLEHKNQELLKSLGNFKEEYAKEQQRLNSWIGMPVREFDIMSDDASSIASYESLASSRSFGTRLRLAKDIWETSSQSPSDYGSLTSSDLLGVQQDEGASGTSPSSSRNVRWDTPLEEIRMISNSADENESEAHTSHQALNSLDERQEGMGHGEIPLTPVIHPHGPASVPVLGSQPLMPDVESPSGGTKLLDAARNVSDALGNLLNAASGKPAQRSGRSGDGVDYSSTASVRSIIQKFESLSSPQTEASSDQKSTRTSRGASPAPTLGRDIGQAAWASSLAKGIKGVEGVPVVEPPKSAASSTASDQAASSAKAMNSAVGKTGQGAMSIPASGSQRAAGKVPFKQSILAEFNELVNYRKDNNQSLSPIQRRDDEFRPHWQAGGGQEFSPPVNPVAPRKETILLRENELERVNFRLAQNLASDPGRPLQGIFSPKSDQSRIVRELSDVDSMSTTSHDSDDEMTPFFSGWKTHASDEGVDFDGPPQVKAVGDDGEHFQAHGGQAKQLFDGARELAQQETMTELLKSLRVAS
ncbi:hypothetical protein [Stenotrophomonas sp.]|uniref:hypothetical protein n=1 Tax=Stenotrophomonas sp. TaxID=69392 RepID=UPI0028B17844|nr:hypothetical protein [Stenotrophomonas sp.]